jgi:hypothetical protein
MNKTLATAVLIIIEAGIEELAERIKKRRRRNGRHHRLTGRSAYDLRDRSAAQSIPVTAKRRGRHTRGRSISQERTEYQERSAVS